MKRPNITQGEWKDWFGMVKTPCMEYTIARCGTDIEFSRSEIEAHAKAISAVPEMIDALIETRNQLTIAMSHEDPIPTKALIDWCTQVEKVLEKAGCTE